MKALTITHASVTPDALLEIAEQETNVWLGIRIAACLLILKGWTSGQVAELFDVSRQSVVQWIHRLNVLGLSGLEEKPRPGRPVRLDTRIQNQLEAALMKSPREAGLSRNRWDGRSVAEYLQQEHGIELKVRQAQRWLRRLGFPLDLAKCRQVRDGSGMNGTRTTRLKKTSTVRGKKR